MQTGGFSLSLPRQQSLGKTKDGDDTFEAGANDDVFWYVAASTPTRLSRLISTDLLPSSGSWPVAQARSRALYRTWYRY